MKKKEKHFQYFQKIALIEHTALGYPKVDFKPIAMLKMSVLNKDTINSFVSNVTFLFPLKTSENRKVQMFSEGVENNREEMDLAVTFTKS